MDRIYLHVSPEEYAEVERAGASWDDESKRWYVTDQENSQLARWIEPQVSEDSLDIFSGEAFVASARVKCFHCGLETEVVCLFGDKGTNAQTGEAIECFTVSNLSAVDAQLRSQLKRWPHYRLSDGVFANRCSRCDGVLEDYRLHSEPGDVFFGISRVSSAHIDFVPLSGSLKLQGDYGFEL